jgi:hypothetical protein
MHENNSCGAQHDVASDNSNASVTSFNLANIYKSLRWRGAECAPGDEHKLSSSADLPIVELIGRNIPTLNDRR